MKDVTIAPWAQNIIKMIARIGVWKTGLSLFAALLIVYGLISLIFYVFHLSIDELKNSFLYLFVLIIVSACSVAGIVYLARNIEKLQQGSKISHAQERQLNQSFMETIRRLNYEIEERKKAFNAKRRAVDELRREMSERKKAQQEFEDQSLLLRSIVDSSPDLFYYRDVNGRFAGCNKMFEAVVGKTANELIGRYVSDVYSIDDTPSSLLSESIVAGNQSEVTFDAKYDMPNGETRWFEMRKVPFYDSNRNFIGMLGFGRDITARKAAEQELEKSYQDKGKFIATLSHELRTPLNGIVGLSRMLLESDLSKLQRSWSNTIFSSAETLGNIFNDIIDLDKIDRNEVDIVTESVLLNDFISDLSNFGTLICQQKELTFQQHTSGNLEQFVELDTTRVRQVLWNLINNAVKFTRKGGVELDVSFQQKGDGGWQLVIRVKDSGIGISGNDLSQIFDMYYKVPDGRRINAQGSGIGLAVSKALVEAMGGWISVESTLDVGSTFTVSLPAEVAAPPEESEYLGKHLNVLLIEDVPLNAKIATSLLEQRGHEVIWAEDGAEALALLDTEDDIDLILLDMQLPDMTGDEVARIIRADDELKHHIIIVVTANVRKASEQLTDIEIQGTLGKPINTQQLDFLLNKYFGDTGGQMITADYSSTSQASSPGNSNTSTGLSAIEQNAPEGFENIEGLDLSTISDYLTSLGKDAFSQSLALFEKLAPGYIDDMLNAANDEIIEDFQSHAHKLKGAAGSVGLQTIQQKAKYYEHLAEPIWGDMSVELSEYLTEIEQDVIRLRDLLNSQA